MKNLTWQNPGQLFVAQELIKIVKLKCCGIKALKDFKPDKPISRSIIPQVAHAYLYNKVISISFEEVMQIVTIKITIESIGETVYSQEYMSPAEVSIDLNIQDSGTYYIEIISDKISLEGEFAL